MYACHSLSDTVKLSCAKIMRRKSRSQTHASVRTQFPCRSCRTDRRKSAIISSAGLRYGKKIPLLGLFSEQREHATHILSHNIIRVSKGERSLTLLDLTSYLTSDGPSLHSLPGLALGSRRAGAWLGLGLGVRGAAHRAQIGPKVSVVSMALDPLDRTFNYVCSSLSIYLWHGCSMVFSDPAYGSCRSTVSYFAPELILHLSCVRLRSLPSRTPIDRPD